MAAEPRKSLEWLLDRKVWMFDGPYHDYYTLLIDYAQKEHDTLRENLKTYDPEHNKITNGLGRIERIENHITEINEWAEFKKNTN